jgi:hypothetical protein
MVALQTERKAERDNLTLALSCEERGKKKNDKNSQHFAVG